VFEINRNEALVESPPRGRYLAREILVKSEIYIDESASEAFLGVYTFFAEH